MDERPLYDPIVCPRRNGLALAAEHVRLNLPLLRLRSCLSLSLSRTRLDAMPAHRVSVPISVEDMDRLCANDSGVSTAIRTVLRDQTRTARLGRGFTSSLTEGEARSFLRYAKRQDLRATSDSPPADGAGKVGVDAEWRTSPCSGS